MRRRTLWILAIVLVLLVGAAVALVLTQKPSLDDARDAVDTRWDAVRPALEARYEKLDAARASFVEAAGGERTAAAELRRDLSAWRRALEDGDAGDQVRASNRLEADGTRLQANVLGSPRLNQSQPLLDALAAYNASAPDPALVRAYNRSVRDYEDTRTGSLEEPVARVFGFGARPVLVVGTQ
jgi:hypothetical protein